MSDIPAADTSRRSIACEHFYGATARLAAEKYVPKDEATVLDEDGQERSDQLTADECIATARADGGEQQ